MVFPSHAVCVEGPMQPDVEASLEVLRAFNRWLDEDWGFAYQNRIFGVPFLSLSKLDRAIVELEWVISRGARVITLRNGPVFTPEGCRSPADPAFDPFWARVAEARRGGRSPCRLRRRLPRSRRGGRTGLGIRRITSQ